MSAISKRQKTGKDKGVTMKGMIKRSVVKKAIEDELELDGQIPLDLWDLIVYSVKHNKREIMAETYRSTVRQTKAGILKRLNF